MICPRDTSVSEKSPITRRQECLPFHFYANGLHITCDFSSSISIDNLDFFFIFIMYCILFHGCFPPRQTSLIYSCCTWSLARASQAGNMFLRDLHARVRRVRLKTFLLLVESLLKALELNSIFGLPAGYLYNVKVKLIINAHMNDHLSKLDQDFCLKTFPYIQFRRKF